MDKVIHRPRVVAGTQATLEVIHHPPVAGTQAALEAGAGCRLCVWSVSLQREPGFCGCLGEHAFGNVWQGTGDGVLRVAALPRVGQGEHP